jgi:hypothetical protein
MPKPLEGKGKAIRVEKNLPAMFSISLEKQLVILKSWVVNGSSIVTWTRFFKLKFYITMKKC